MQEYFTLKIIWPANNLHLSNILALKCGGSTPHPPHKGVGGAHLGVKVQLWGPQPHIWTLNNIISQVK